MDVSVFPNLKRIHARRLRELYRSAGWPYQDVIEIELLAAGLLERIPDDKGGHHNRIYLSLCRKPTYPRSLSKCDIIGSAYLEPAATPRGKATFTSEMRQRDALVFQLAAMRRLPLVWCLAGGYQRDKNGGIEPVLALHRQTMVECLKVSGT